MKALNILFLCLWGSIIISCKNNSIDATSLLEERDSLINISCKQEEELNMLTSVMNSIYTTVDSITQQEKYIYIAKENNVRNKKLLMEQLTFLGELLERQRNVIKQLSDSLVNDSLNMIPSKKKLLSIISFLEAQLEEKDITINNLRREISRNNTNITQLKKTVVNLETNISDLTEKNEAQLKALEVQNEMLNMGYFIVGTKNELKEAGIIKTNLFNIKLDIDPSQIDKFTAVDLRNFNEITIKSKKIKVLSQMPKSSYEIKNNNDNTSTLVIINTDEFWHFSNYLVIQSYK